MWGLSLSIVEKLGGGLFWHLMALGSGQEVTELKSQN